MVILFSLSLVAISGALGGLPKQTHDGVANALEMLKEIEFQLLVLLK
jgi:hypothetical protein